MIRIAGAFLSGAVLALILLLSPFLQAAEPEKDPPSSSLLNTPMLESDWPRVTAPSPMRTSQPDLLELPALADPLPSDPPENVPAPSPLLVRGPRLQAEADPTLDPTAPEPDPLTPVPAAPGSVDPIPTVATEVPDTTVFANPQFKAPPTLAPEVFGIPNPIQELGTRPGDELLGAAPVNLSRRYSLHLQGLLSGLYDDSAVVLTSGRKPDLVISFVPAVTFTMGTAESQAAAQFIYAPLINWWTQGTTKDGVNQNAQINSRFKTGRLFLGLNLSAATSISGGNLDTGPVSDSKTYLGTLTAVYNFTGKTSLDVALDETVLDYSSSSKSDETRLQGFANYQLGNFRFGAGALAGLVDAKEEPSQRYFQSLGRIIYTPLGKKLAVTAVAGYEFRDLGANKGHTTDPVFQIAASYLLFPQTTLSVDTLRRVYPSVSSSGQNYVLVSFNGMIRREFTGYGRHFFLSFAGGIQNSKYSGSGTEGGDDDYFYTRFAFDWVLRQERALLGGFYEYSEDSPSRQGALGFKRNRIGLQLTLIFF